MPPRDVPDHVETERLRIRAPRAGDGPALHVALLESWEGLARWVPWSKERPTEEETEAEVRRLEAKFTDRSELAMLIFRRDADAVVGMTGLHRIDWAGPRFETGVWIRPSMERKGYGGEALRAMARMALGPLRGQRVQVYCSHRNETSVRMTERCGFVFEGRLRNHARESNGDLRDAMVYSLVPDDSVARELLRS